MKQVPTAMDARTRRGPPVMRAMVTAIGLSLALSACQGQNEDSAAMTPAQSAEAKSMLHDYASARDGGNWTVAEALAENLRKRYPDSDETARVAQTLVEVHEQAAAQREALRLEQLWTYQAVAVGKGVQRTASIDSRTAQVGEAELPPPADAQLILRDHPDWGRSAYLLLAEQKFDCGKPCTLTLRFDDGTGSTWTGKQADSGKGPALFIVDDGKFIAALSKAKLLRIGLPAGSGRISSLGFDVGGYHAERFASSLP